MNMIALAVTVGIIALALGLILGYGIGLRDQGDDR